MGLRNQKTAKQLPLSNVKEKKKKRKREKIKEKGKEKGKREKGTESRLSKRI